ncbi:MAG: hypothetical protein GX094_02455 [Clostridiales bacterium]|jgi:hypothetical protein|nr:hypothetical protein [Clostridiales bacterium]
MEIPDLLGLFLNDALDLLEKDYPELRAVVVRYSSPVSTKAKDKTTGTERIIRQRVCDPNKIELIVSSFYDFQLLD